MKLNIDFSALEEAVRKMGAEIVITGGFVSELPPLTTPEGVNIPAGGIDWIEAGNGASIATFNGEVVLLFIPDHTGHAMYKKYAEDIQENPEKGNKVHIADCETLKGMKEKGRYERYRATNNTDGFVTIEAISRSGEVVNLDVELKVCKMCLRHLNYKNYINNKKKVFEEFTFAEFLKEYQPYFSQQAGKATGTSEHYTGNWQEISKQYRRRHNFQCEECKVNLKDHLNLLQVHHKNGVKSDNRDENLKAVCIECHSREEGHSHMRVSNEQKIILANLRLLQGLRRLY